MLDWSSRLNAGFWLEVSLWLGLETPRAHLPATTNQRWVCTGSTNQMWVLYWVNQSETSIYLDTHHHLGTSTIVRQKELPGGGAKLVVVNISSQTWSSLSVDHETLVVDWSRSISGLVAHPCFPLSEPGCWQTISVSLLTWLFLVQLLELLQLVVLPLRDQPLLLLTLCANDQLWTNQKRALVCVSQLEESIPTCHCHVTPVLLMKEAEHLTRHRSHQSINTLKSTRQHCSMSANQR